MIIVSDFVKYTGADDLLDRNPELTVGVGSGGLSLRLPSASPNYLVFIEGIVTDRETVRITSGGSQTQVAVAEEVYLGRKRAVLPVPAGTSSRDIVISFPGGSGRVGLVRVWNPSNAETRWVYNVGFQWEIGDKKIQAELAEGSTVEQEIPGDPVLRFRFSLRSGAQEQDFFDDSPAMRNLLKILRGAREILIWENRLPWHAYLMLKKTPLIGSSTGYNRTDLGEISVEVI